MGQVEFEVHPTDAAAFRHHRVGRRFTKPGSRVRIADDGITVLRTRWSRTWPWDRLELNGIQADSVCLRPWERSRRIVVPRRAFPDDPSWAEFCHRVLSLRGEVNWLAGKREWR